MRQSLTISTLDVEFKIIKAFPIFLVSVIILFINRLIISISMGIKLFLR